MVFILSLKGKSFQSSLLKWDIKPANKKLWNQFKIFFRKVQVTLWKAGSLTVEEGINHSKLVNMLSQGVKPDESMNNIQNEHILQDQINEGPVDQ